VSSRPDFSELVGGDLAPGERERLERVHDLLVAAGPPPDVTPALESPQTEGSRLRVLPRRQRGALMLLAAALAAIAFGAGYLVRGGRDKPAQAFRATKVVRLHKTAMAPHAVAVVRVGRRNGDGNLPMLVSISGLPKLGKSGYYTLALTKNGRPVVSCGTFKVGSTRERVTVRMTVAYDVTEFDGWVVTEYKHGRKAEPVVLTT
jgi:hypothetical protein